MIINSGGSKSYSAVVNNNGRLLVSSISNEHIFDASLNGQTYSIYSDFITLTTLTAFSGILWVKNTSTKPFLVESIDICGTALGQWYLYKNVTTGTLVSAGVAKVPSNLNLGVSLSFAGSVLAGADARTITDGTIVTQKICNTGDCHLRFNDSLILPQNSSIALSCKPSAIGTYCAFVHGFFDDREE